MSGGVSVSIGGSGDGCLLEGEHLLELDSVADVAVGEIAFMDDAANALNDGTRATGKISGHAQSHEERRADPQRQGTTHEEAGAGDVDGF